MSETKVSLKNFLTFPTEIGFPLREDCYSYNYFKRALDVIIKKRVKEGIPFYVQLLPYKKYGFCKRNLVDKLSSDTELNFVRNYEYGVIYKRGYFDIDPPNDKDYSEGGYIAWELCNRLHNYLEETKISHSVEFTGKGYRILVYLDEDTDFINWHGFHWHVASETGVLSAIDPTVIGDPSRIIRVWGSVNKKTFHLNHDDGGLWCTSLTNEEFSSGHENIINRARTRREFIIIHGNEWDKYKPVGYENCVELRPCYSNNRSKDSYINIDVDMDDDIDKIVEFVENFIGKKLKVPATPIKKGMNGETGHYKRFSYILYLRNLSLLRSQIYTVLKEVLFPEEYNKVLGERQVEFIYNNYLNHTDYEELSKKKREFEMIEYEEFAKNKAKYFGGI